MGHGKLDFGNCINQGSVDVYLDGTKISSASLLKKSVIVEFDFKDGSTLELLDVGVSIIQFNSFEYECQVGSIRSKRQADSFEVSDEVEDKKNKTKIDKTKEFEPSLDRVFVPSKKAIYEARKQYLRAINKFNFKNLDLKKSFPYLFEILW